MNLVLVEELYCVHQNSGTTGGRGQAGAPPQCARMRRGGNGGGGLRYADKMVVLVLVEEAATEAAGLSCLVSLPGEVLEYILCSGSLTAADLGRVSSACRRLRKVCQSSRKVWKEQFR